MKLILLLAATAFFGVQELSAVSLRSEGVKEESSGVQEFRSSGVQTNASNASNSSTRQLVNSSTEATNSSTKKTSWTADNGNGTFTNPLFYDEFSDPDILRVGDDYYLAGTTMHTVPGLVILHSKDLVNWENVSYCFDRFDFPEDRFALKNHQEIYGQGIWAPCIRYANGQFYVYSNVNGKGLQCYTSKDIRGPWKHHNMKGNIYDLGVLFDDDGKVYAIHGYGTVKCTELYPDMSGPIEGTERVIIPEGNGVGEGHHMYKINGMYYLISTDYRPNGRTLCSRSKSIWGPYETRVITADETYGYHAASLTQVRGRIVPDGTKFAMGPIDKDATACTNAHQGGIVQATDGSWWALLMMDFHSIGRTVCLMPMTWVDGWPMIGLEGNLGRAPRTWFKPGSNLGVQEFRSVGVQTIASSANNSSTRQLVNSSTKGTNSSTITPHAPYERSDNFDGKQLGRIWQWNHNPDDKMWSLKKGKLHLNSMPAEQLMWARNTLTQRVIGPECITTVELSVKGLKDGDVAGLGNINVPCSWIGIVSGVQELKGVKGLNQKHTPSAASSSSPTTPSTCRWNCLWARYGCAALASTTKTRRSMPTVPTARLSTLWAG